MRVTIVMIPLPLLTQATLEFSVWIRGRSSGVERNLAKVDVVSSNLIARSIFFGILRSLISGAIARRGKLLEVLT